MSPHDYHPLALSRELKQYERDILLFLVHESFPGAPALRKQVDLLYVNAECVDCLAVGFTLDQSLAEPADVKYTVPVEAEGYDLDGMKLHFLLMITNGYIDELVIYREDLQQIRSLPLVLQRKVG